MNSLMSSSKTVAERVTHQPARRWLPLGAHREVSVKKRRSTWRILACSLGALATFTWAPLAAAQGKVVTIAEVTIVGRVQKPIAAVDVSRIQPQMTLGELRQPFLDRIEKAVYRAPF